MLVGNVVKSRRRTSTAAVKALSLNALLLYCLMSRFSCDQCLASVSCHDFPVKGFFLSSRNVVD